MSEVGGARAAAGESRFAQAAGWYLRIRDAQADGDELSPEELKDWEMFVSDSENYKALELAVGVSSRFDRMHRAGTIFSGLNRRPGPLPPNSRQRGKWRLPVYLGVAVCMVLVAIGGYHIFLERDWSAQTAQMFSTAIGQKREITLADGSTLVLGGQTEVAVRYSTSARNIDLTHGEALFSVSHDPHRPFIVHAGSGSITAVGTQFDVRCDLDRVTVAVARGVVLVAPERDTARASPNGWHAVRVRENQEVTYGGEIDGIGPVGRADPNVTAWTEGILEYRDVPLKYVITDVNRYGNPPIVLGDPTAGRYEFTGTVFSRRVDEWANSLERIFPLRARTDGGHIVIEDLGRAKPIHRTAN